MTEVPPFVDIDDDGPGEADLSSRLPVRAFLHHLGIWIPSVVYSLPLPPPLNISHNLLGLLGSNKLYIQAFISFMKGSPM